MCVCVCVRRAVETEWIAQLIQTVLSELGCRKWGCNKWGLKGCLASSVIGEANPVDKSASLFVSICPGKCSISLQRRPEIATLIEVAVPC